MRRFRLLAGTTIYLGLCFDGQALAQTQVAGAANDADKQDSHRVDGQEAGGLQEIMVTARRREESQQKVPISITALTQQQLKSANVTQIADLQTAIPSLQIAPSTGRSNALSFTIRGQKQADPRVTGDPSVGVYYAEAVQSRIFGLGQSLFDLESIQVLKGPQGTLFGRSTTGGAILIQPTRPQLDDFSGYATTRIGNFGRFDVQGAVTVPVDDIIAARFAYNRTRRAGFATDVSTGEKLNQEHTDTARAIFLLKPSASFTDTLYLDYYTSGGTGSALRLTAVNPAGQGAKLGLVQVFAHQKADLGFYDVESNVDPHSTGSNIGITNVTEADVSDGMHLKNIVNYRRIKYTEYQDLDGTAVPLIELKPQNALVSQATEEFQVQSKLLDGKIQWINGVFAFIEDGYERTLTSVAGAPPSPRRGDATNVSGAIFSQADIKPIETLTVTLGGRYNYDDRQFTQTILSASTGLCTFCASASKSFTSATYTAGLSWQVTPTKLLYATTRKGYRPGGFNANAVSLNALAAYRPETVEDYEIGLKGDWALGPTKLRTNVAIYHSNYKNIQRVVVLPINGAPTNSIFNAASADINGGELEVDFLPISGLTFAGNLSYTDPKYNQFTYYDPAAGLIDASGNRFAGVAKWTYSLAVRGEFPLGASPTKLFAGLDYYHQSSIYYSDVNKPYAYQGGYGLLGGRIELRNISGKHFDVALWGRNLANRHYYSSEADLYTSSGVVFSSLGEPRTFGIEVTTRF